MIVLYIVRQPSNAADSITRISVMSVHFISPRPASFPFEINYGDEILSMWQVFNASLKSITDSFICFFLFYWLTIILSHYQ